MPKTIGKIPAIFFIISNLKNKSERPFTCSIFKLIACKGYNIPEKQII